jgi:hypothetical protein
MQRWTASSLAASTLKHLLIKCSSYCREVAKEVALRQKPDYQVDILFFFEAPRDHRG